MGWFTENSDRVHHAVGEKPANPWGLYDVHGNEWEWTASRWKDTYSGQADGLKVDPSEDLADPAERAPRGRRVIRGGGYWFAALWCRAASRGRWDPGDRSDYQGFRVLLPFAPSEPRS